MRRFIHAMSDTEKQQQQLLQQLTDELMMPTGVPGVLAIAGLLILVGLWVTPGITKYAHGIVPSDAAPCQEMSHFSRKRHFTSAASFSYEGLLVATLTREPPEK